LEISAVNLPLVKPLIKGPIEVKKQKDTWYLFHDNIQLMQWNTKSNREVKELYSSYDLAYGDVLVTGLGFGILTLWLSKNPRVKSITVIEVSQDVIDVFLLNNVIPDNVTIICADALTYKTTTFYDCILLDHFKDGTYKKDLTKENLQIVFLNIPNHTIFWFWDIERQYVRDMWKITDEDLFVVPIDFTPYDFPTKWGEWLSQVNIRTIPVPTPEKLNSYINLRFNRG
jgi:hypothetical protein